MLCDSEFNNIKVCTVSCKYFVTEHYNSKLIIVKCSV